IPAAREAADCARRSASSSHQKQQRQRKPDAPSSAASAGDAVPSVGAAASVERKKALDEKRGSTNSKLEALRQQREDRKKKQLLKASDVVLGTAPATATMAEAAARCAASAKRKVRGQLDLLVVLVLLLFVQRRHVRRRGRWPLKARRRSSDDDGEDSESHATGRTRSPAGQHPAEPAQAGALLVHMPFFARLVVGCFIGLGIGSHHDQTPGKHADEQNPASAARKDEKNFRMEFVSNQEFTPKEFEAHHGAQGGAEIRRHINYEIKDDAELEKIIQEKRRFVSLSVNPAYRKAQLLKERGLAELEGDLEKVRQLQEQLQDVEDEQRRVEEARLQEGERHLRGEPEEPQRQPGLAEQALKEEYQEPFNFLPAAPGARSGVQGGDPFTRRTTRPSLCGIRQKQLLMQQQAASQPKPAASPSSPSLPLPANRHQPPPLLPTPRAPARTSTTSTTSTCTSRSTSGGGHPGGLPQQPGGAGDLLARSASGRSLNLDDRSLTNRRLKTATAAAGSIKSDLSAVSAATSKRWKTSWQNLNGAVESLEASFVQQSPSRAAGSPLSRVQALFSQRASVKKQQQQQEPQATPKPPGQ
uniref:BZIP domain-containing protein n=1 Tax=Macrostomum lignano TaxID=282301 RepID=A0A1I8JLX4_9PLAT